MMDIYKNCPVLESDQFLMRFVEYDDTADLLKVYSDKKAVPYFNGDNCNGDRFYYKTFERMEEAIGTIELFHRNANDYFDACGLLRLDLRSNYENENCIFSILSAIVPQAYDLFHCNRIATKAAAFAEERIKVLKQMNFKRSVYKLTGHDGTEYGDYWVRSQVNTGHGLD